MCLHVLQVCVILVLVHPMASGVKGQGKHIIRQHYDIAIALTMISVYCQVYCILTLTKLGMGSAVGKLY